MRNKSPGATVFPDAATMLAASALCVELTVSGNLLMWAGIPYIASGGNPVFKIHPGSYLSFMAFAVRMLARSDPWARLRSLVCLAPGLAFFIAAVLMCTAYAACMTGPGGLIALIDTFLPAGTLAAALLWSPREQLVHLALLLRALFVLNAAVALGEAAAGAHLVPIAGDTPELQSEFRPTGLYDHPLTAATSTMMGVLLRARRRPDTLPTKMADAVLLLALCAFGGRIALLLTLVAVGAIYGAGVWRKAIRRALSPAMCLSALAACMAGAAALAAIAGTGIGARLMAHLYWDASAQSRISEFGVLGRLSGEQVLFGCRREDLVAMIEPLRLQSGVDVIENFWLLMFCTLGVFCFPLFVCAIAGLSAFLLRCGAARARLMVVLLLLAASSSNSLGRKSTLLVTLVGCVAACEGGWRIRRPHAVPVGVRTAIAALH